MTHNQNTGEVTLRIAAIGPGDEGEYTCTASNEYGEAICTVYIQPEGKESQSPDHRVRLLIINVNFECVCFDVICT